MCLRLVYLLITKLFAWLRLSHRDESFKTAEILLLRHQLTLVQRQVHSRPKITWADRALIALLLNVIPRQRRAGARLIVSPATVLRWHRDIVPPSLGSKVAAQATWSPSYPPYRRELGTSAGAGESCLGVPADPR